MPILLSRIFLLHTHRLLATLVLVALTTLSGCTKLDDNGEFYGYWLLVERSGTATTTPERYDVSLNVNTDNINLQEGRVITWAVRGEVIMVRDLAQSDYYFFRFTRTDDALIFSEAFCNDGTSDQPITFDHLPEEFGIPENGRLTILTLTHNRLELEGRDGIHLYFKKN